MLATTNMNSVFESDEISNEHLFLLICKAIVNKITLICYYNNDNLLREMGNITNHVF